MYNTELARKILDKLDEAFPGRLHFGELQAALPEYEPLPRSEWLSAVQALRLENKLDGKFLPDETSIADAAALHITDLGRSQLRSGFNQDAPTGNGHSNPGEPRSAYSSPLQHVRARFLDGAKKYPDLLAHWAAAEEVWTFRDSPPLEREEAADAESEHLFKDVAGSAVKLIRKVGNAEPPWHVWLDLMRKGKQGFRRRAAQTRSWRQFQIAMESGAEAANLPLTNNGSIAHVFERSAEFCDQLDVQAAASSSGGLQAVSIDDEAEEFRAESAKRREREIEEAIKLFESLPGFASVQIRMRERMAEAKRTLSSDARQLSTKARRPYVLLLLDIRAEQFLELVTDIKTQNAYMAWLPSVESGAWQEYTGAPPGVFSPSSAENLAFEEEIRERIGHWTLEGYRRVESVSKVGALDRTKQESPQESPISQFRQLMESSPRFKTQYLKALTTLLNELNHCWERILPPDARHPSGSCDEFFGPFAQFGVVLYDSCARERLLPSLPLGTYQEALNFELKTLVCELIAPYHEKPLKSFQDAVQADERGEWPGEWRLRMGESWRTFDHPRHRELQQVVRETILDGSVLDWGRLVDRIHNAISKRVVFWLAEHAELAEKSTPNALSKEPEHTPGADRTPRPEIGSEAPPSPGSDRLAAVDAFLKGCNNEAPVGLKILKTHIWRAAGHKSPRQFQYWQTGSDLATTEDDRNFRRIVATAPAVFIDLLKRKGIVKLSS